MTKRWRIVLPLALGALAVLVLASSALATHPKPNGAAKVRITLVPAFKECTVGNTTHGAPLSLSSCNPAVQDSTELTAPNDDTTLANGSITVRYFCTNGVLGDPLCGAAGDQADVRLISSGNDVRCKPGHAAVTSCGSTNATGGPDYTGQVLGTAVIRITDHYNGPPGFTSTATVIDTDFPVGAQCTATAATDRGSSCGITTSADAVVPDVVKEDKRSSVEIQQIQVLDAGATDGVLAGAGGGLICPPSCVGTGDEKLYSVQGIFIP
jgi:hypothetical protein